MKTSLALILLLAGCTAELKEANTELSDRLGRVQLDAKRLETDKAKLQLRVQDLELDLARLRLATSIGVDPTQPLFATIETGVGSMLCELEPARAPQTVASFVGLAEGTRTWRDPATGEAVKRPLYDGLIFHRVVPGELIQGGDPEGTGQGGPGFAIPDELHPELTHVAGALGMANSGPGTGGSQFFVALDRLPHLDGKHTIFGQCEDLEVAQEISRGKLSAGANSTRPAAPISIRGVKIHRGAKPR